MKMFRAVAAGALAAASIAAAAAAVPAPPPSNTIEQQQSYFIAFDPYLDEPIRYRHETIKEKAGETTQTNKIVTLRFAATENGYRVAVAEEIAPGSDERPPLPGMEHLQALSEVPYTLLLDEYGDVVALEEEQVYLDAISAAFEAMATSAETPPGAATMIRGFARRFAELPAADRLAMLTGPVQPMLGMGALELTLGERISFPMELPTPFGPMAADMHMSLRSAENGLAEITSYADISREAFETLMRRLLELAPPERRQAAEDTLASGSDFSFAIRETFHVYMDSGLLERYHLEKSFSVVEGETRHRAREIQTITLLD